MSGRVMLRVNKSRASKGRSPYARTRSGVAIATSATQSQAGPTPMQPEAPVVVPIPIRTLSATSLSSVAGIASTAGPSSFTAQQTNPEAIPVSVASVIETVASQQSTTPSAATVVAVSSTSTWGSTVSLSSSYTILGDYQSTVNSLLDASLSVNTSKVYKQGLQAFYRFRSETSFEQNVFGLLDPLLYTGHRNMQLIT
ncbi:alpha-amylase-like isoform X3 [Saccostrea cucullata]|uniref:alpha-amylase-like isoform X3 n=1 Tax=Saccostrea cuccullata TaxID=36930 RepID=UPI002ED252F2